MTPEFRKVALIAASLGLLVSVFFALRPDEQAAPATTARTTVPATTGDEQVATVTAAPPDEPVTIRIAVRSDTAPRLRRFSVRLNREVEVVVRSELTDHVHLHGYDLIADVGPGRPGRITFTANAAGRFELELEDRGLAIAELEVRP